MTKCQCPITVQAPMPKGGAPLVIGHWSLVGHWDLGIGHSSRGAAPRHVRGFTVMELCFGMVITALVMAAVATFLMAVSQSWRHSDQVETSTMRAWQATVRLGRAVQDARLIGAYSAGDIDAATPTPAAVLLWAKDTNGDGKIQGAECAMIEHDDVQQTLRLYHAGQGDAAVVIPWSTFTSAAILSNFKVGRAYTPVARGVERVRFAAFGTTGTAHSPMLEYTMKIVARGSNAGQRDDHGSRVVEYGTCAIRAPAKQPT